MRTRRGPLRHAPFAVAALVALLALAACGGGDDSGGTSKGGGRGGGGSATAVYGPGDSISVSTGERFVIELESNPTTGYEWTAEPNDDVEFLGSRMVTSSTLPGAPGMQRLTFEATKAGSSTLVLTYARSFEPDNPPAQTEDFPLTVK